MFLIFLILSPLGFGSLWSTSLSLVEVGSFPNPCVTNLWLQKHPIVHIQVINAKLYHQSSWYLHYLNHVIIFLICMESKARCSQQPPYLLLKLTKAFFLLNGPQTKWGMHFKSSNMPSSKNYFQITNQGKPWPWGPIRIQLFH